MSNWTNIIKNFLGFLIKQDGGFLLKQDGGRIILIKKPLWTSLLKH